MNLYWIISFSTTFIGIPFTLELYVRPISICDLEIIHIELIFSALSWLRVGLHSPVKFSESLQQL